MIGTETTIQSGAYTHALKAADGAIEVYSRACPLFVPLVEEGWTDNEVVEMTARAYLQGFKQSGIDTLILARIASPMETGGGPAAILRQASGQTATAAEMKAGLGAQDQYVREAAAWAFTQRQEATLANAGELVRSLHDSDPVVRGLSALALSQCASCAGKALHELTTALEDPDENVRLAAADAIAVVGPGAAPSGAGSVLAAAAGNGGPAAAPAIPVLEKLERIPRVEWPARQAIAKIQGH